MIEVENLRFAYDDRRFQLQVASFQVARGAATAITGPSGAGKTTLLHLLAGILLPQAGRIRVDGVDLVGLSEAERRSFRIARLGLVFQDFALVNYLSVLDNILLPYWMHESMSLTPEARTRAWELASHAGLEDLLDQPPERLSQGERQRVAVCRALVASPHVVLADEPTANLDSYNAARVVEALTAHAAAAQAALIVVTHDEETARGCSHRVDWSAIAEIHRKSFRGSDGDAR